MSRLSLLCATVAPAAVEVVGHDSGEYLGTTGRRYIHRRSSGKQSQKVPGPLCAHMVERRRSCHPRPTHLQILKNYIVRQKPLIMLEQVQCGSNSVLVIDDMVTYWRSENLNKSGSGWRMITTVSLPFLKPSCSRACRSCSRCIRCNADPILPGQRGQCCPI